MDHLWTLAILETSTAYSRNYEVSAQWRGIALIISLLILLADLWPNHLPTIHKKRWCIAFHDPCMQKMLLLLHSLHPLQQHHLDYSYSMLPYWITTFSWCLDTEYVIWLLFKRELYYLFSVCSTSEWDWWVTKIPKWKYRIQYSNKRLEIMVTIILVAILVTLLQWKNKIDTVSDSTFSPISTVDCYLYRLPDMKHSLWSELRVHCVTISDVKVFW